ncbi:MAG: hypothetical protein Q4F92_00175 [Acidaminococcus sp.]|uniref:hypothetical protein n=1 Tax=Acidaminococcus sp. TaxID=1872103 RepID=UPI0026DF8EE7|nr:hypothetical protein [Acidaminococcus sp.]MDO5596742.1 hypothetical protein [Acidaminococcus sp.]
MGDGNSACRGEKVGKYYIGVLRNLTQGLVPDEMWLARAREWIVRASEDWLSYSMAALVFWFCDKPEEARHAAPVAGCLSASAGGHPGAWGFPLCAGAGDAGRVAH